MTASDTKRADEDVREEEAARLRAVWDRVKNERAAKGLRLTQDWVAGELGMTQGAIYQYRSGKIPLNETFLLKLADLLRFDPREIRPSMTSVPAWMLDSDRRPGPPSDFVGDNVSAAVPIAQVPLISWVAAGSWAEVEDPLPTGEGHEMLNCYRRVGPRAFGLVVQGESMTSASGISFPAGCRIVVDPDVEARSGSFVIAKLESAEEATFKRLVVDAVQTFLEPLNPRYPVITVDQPMRVIGVVVAIAEMPVPY